MLAPMRPTVTAVGFGVRGQEVGAILFKGVVQRIQQGTLLLPGLAVSLRVMHECQIRVARLRERKGRPYKPFAVMAPNRAFCDRGVSYRARGGVTSGPISPIVLLFRLTKFLPGVARGSMGVMLSYSPLHFLLFHQAVAVRIADWLHTALPHL